MTMEEINRAKMLIDNIRETTLQVEDVAKIESLAIIDLLAGGEPKYICGTEKMREIKDIIIKDLCDGINTWESELRLLLNKSNSIPEICSD